MLQEATPQIHHKEDIHIKMLKRGTVSVEWQLVVGLLPEAAYTAGWKLESHQKDLVKF